MKSLYLVLILAIASCHGAKFVDQITRQYARLFAESRNGTLIRQCSCEEQDSCILQIKSQVDGCFDSCWNDVILVQRSAEIKKCFKIKEYIVDDLVECAAEKLHSCVDNKHGKDIPYVDFTILLEKSEKKIQTQIRNFMTTLGESGREMVKNGLKIGTCMKNCFIHENAGGFCWDLAGCQPMIDVKIAAKLLKQCIKKIKWKKEASETCNCMVSSGVKEMEQYCIMLGTIAGH